MAFGGTERQHRGFAASDARAFRAAIRAVKSRARTGDCRIAMRRLLDAERILGMYVAERRHGGARSLPRGYRNLGRTDAARRYWNDRCAIVHR